MGKGKKKGRKGKHRDAVVRKVATSWAGAPGNEETRAQLTE